MRRPTRSFTVERKKGSRPAGDRSEATPAPFEPPQAPAPRRAQDPNRAAAEALFSMPAPAPSEGGDAPQAPQRRILESLEEQPSPFANYTPLTEEPKRRGRKPADPEGDPAAAPPKRRGRKPGPAAPADARDADLDGELDADADMVEDDDGWMEAAPAPAALPAELPTLRRAGRVPRSELPRGERWKARLPRYAR